jgi:hypothetical protein
MTEHLSRREMFKASSLLGAAALPALASAGETAADQPNPLCTVRSRLKNDHPWLMPAHFGTPPWGGEEPYPDPPGEVHCGDETGNKFEQFKNDSRHGGMLGWKYVPGESSSDEPLASYATEYPVTTEYHEAWSAEGSFEWHPQSWRDNPTQSHIVNALHALPVKETMSCTVTKASKILHVARVRRLR